MEKDKGWVVASMVGIVATRSRRTATAAQEVGMVAVVLLLLLHVPWPVVREGVIAPSARRLSCGAMLAAAQAAAAAALRSWGKGLSWRCEEGGM